MEGRKGILLVFFTLAVTVLSMAASLRNQEPLSQTEPRMKDPRELLTQYPARAYSGTAPESDDPKKKAKRASKNRRYDKKGIVPGNTKGFVWWGNDWTTGLTGIPVSQSTAIVVGEVLDAQAHLSDDKGAVYSEFTVRVEESLKGEAGTPIGPGSLITVERFGGIVKYGPENFALFRAVGQDLPRAKRRYAFFLNKTEEDDYAIALGYELRGGRVVPLDEIEQTAPYKGEAEAAFLQAIRTAVTQSR